MARPKKFDENDLIEKLNNYIDSESEPMIQEFALNYGINRCYLYELAEKNEILSNTIKRLMDKQELYLIRQTEKGNINATFAIFRLKQKPFNWTDKQEIESKNDTKLTVTLDQQLSEWSK